jgi:hypothetical protein
MSYSENINWLDSSGNTVNPATEETVMYLRKLVELLQPLATQDPNQRLRVSVDAGTITTVSSVTGFGGAATLPTVTNLTQLAAVDARYIQMDTAKLLYTQHIRSKLSFS